MYRDSCLYRDGSRDGNFVPWNLVRQVLVDLTGLRCIDQSVSVFELFEWVTKELKWRLLAV